MPRKANPTPEDLDDKIIACFISETTGEEVTTPAERKEIVARWAAGNYTHHREMAEQKKLTPIALLLAALIDCDHPLLVSPGRGRMYSTMECCMIVLNVMAKEAPVSTPFQIDSLHNQGVERMEQVPVVHMEMVE